MVYQIEQSIKTYDEEMYIFLLIFNIIALYLHDCTSNAIMHNKRKRIDIQNIK